MKKTPSMLAAALVAGAIGGSLFKGAIAQEAQAQAEARVRAPKVKNLHAEENQRFMTESLGITGGHMSARASSTVRSSRRRSYGRLRG